MVQPSRVSEDYANKVPEVTLGFWIIKNSRNDARGDPRRLSHHDLAQGRRHGQLRVPGWKCDFSFGLDRARGRSDFCQEISSLPLLVGHRGINHCRHGCGRLCHPITGDRLYWRVTDPVRLSDDCACILVSIRGLHLGRYGEHTEGRSLLLGGDYIFPDVGNRPWRLDRRYRSWIRRRGAGLWRRTGGHCRSLLLDECVAGLAVLGRLHSNATTRCDVG